MPKKKKSNSDEIIVEDNLTKATLIFLHGFGDNGVSWLFFANELRKYISNLRIILPSAVENEISIDNSVTPSWFDITEYPISKNYMDNGKYLNYSLEEIHKLIDKEIEKGVNPNKIFIGGFSQGAAMSLIAALKHPVKLGGVIMLSGWIFKNTDLLNKPTNLPIFIGHGDKDKIVLYENAENLNNVLSKSGFTNITFQRYKNMGHSTSTTEINDVIKWLSVNLAK